MTKTRFIYRNQTGLQHLLRNKHNIKYFTFDKIEGYISHLYLGVCV